MCRKFRNITAVLLAVALFFSSIPVNAGETELETSTTVESETERIIENETETILETQAETVESTETDPVTEIETEASEPEQKEIETETVQTESTQDETEIVRDAQISLGVEDSDKVVLHIETWGSNESDAKARIYFWKYSKEIPSDLSGFENLLDTPYGDIEIESILDDNTVTLGYGITGTYKEETENGKLSAAYIEFTIPENTETDGSITISCAEEIYLTVTAVFTGNAEVQDAIQIHLFPAESEDISEKLAEVETETAFETMEEEETKNVPETEAENDNETKAEPSLVYVEEEPYSSETEAISYVMLTSPNEEENGIMLASEDPTYNWSIDAYYVNEDNYYDVTKTDDFNLKYQVEFHTSEEIGEGNAVIRVPASLFTLRDGESEVIPDDIGVPYGVPGNSKSSTTTPFNYYYETDSETGKQYIVFWNYRTITAGTNSAFQILYRDIDVMEVEDMTGWSITPEATVSLTGDVQIQKTSSLTGTVDTYATITSVTKEAYYESGKKYTPALYTETQVLTYAGIVLSDDMTFEDYFGLTDTTFDDYYYVVWKITVSGAASQMWNLSTEELIDGSAGSFVVGYSWLRETSSDGYQYTYGWDESDASISDCTEETIRLKYLVVTAYLKDEQEENTSGSVEVSNTVNTTVIPADGYDTESTANASDTYQWMEYDWVYETGIIRVTKEEDTTYSAWLDVYENGQTNNEDTGDYAFTTTSEAYGYQYTHVIDENNSTDDFGVGDYIPGTYYEVTTVDDTVYAYPNSDSSEAVLLGDGDYYFKSVSIIIQDRGYDVYEAKLTSPETVDDVSQDATIYAMYQGSDEWSYVDEIEWDESGIITYSFPASALAKKPYRIMVVHDTINYYTSCDIIVTMALNYDSENIMAIQKKYGDNLDELRLEDISGTMMESFSDGVSSGYLFLDEGDLNYDNYPSSLSEQSTDLYGALIQRDNAYAILTRLEKHVAANKSYKTTNDSANSRMLVDYYLTAYEGYIVSGSSTVDQLKSQGITMPSSGERTEVVFYDLLPTGMVYNASAGVTAGRLTTISGSTWKNNSRAWDTSDITVTVSEDDVIENWNGTGRTMIAFHITYTGDSPDIYNSGMWMVGYAIQFQAYFEWADAQSVYAEANICAYMPEKDDAAGLYGSENEVYDDDGSGATGIYAQLAVEDLNGDGNTMAGNILYAASTMSMDFASSVYNGISKLVKSDNDPFGVYSTTASVGYGDEYTYQISLSNAQSTTMKNIVIYDILENGISRYGMDGETVFDGYSKDEGYWLGTLASVVTESLSAAGISPVVYYNINNVEDVTVTSGTETPDTVLTNTNGWYTETELSAVGYSLSDVTAIAVDISKNADGTAFVLEAGETVSFYIHMDAPVDDQTALYSFNNAGYYCVTVEDSVLGTTEETSATVWGSSVRTSLEDLGTVSVMKEFDSTIDVPDGVTDTEFTFVISRDGEALANQKYLLYNLSDNGDWVLSSVVLASDADGEFVLKAGQKAVFPEINHYDEVLVNEKANVFWSSECTKKEDNITSCILSYTYTNTYRPPVYFYKTALVTDNAGSLDDYKFVFTIYTSKDGITWEPYADAEIAYVKNVQTDGTSPNVLNTGTTDSNGQVIIGTDDIIAFFPGEEGVYYKIVETVDEENWICSNPEEEGVVVTYGTSSTISNIYKYRSLIFTKKLDGLNENECTDTFTFRIYYMENDEKVYLDGNTWVMLDSDGEEKTENGEAVIGIIEDGYFSITGAGSDNRICINSLEAGLTYYIEEVTEGQDNDGNDYFNSYAYEIINNGITDVSMPTWSSKTTASITNKYLLKDLEVSKQVFASDISYLQLAKNTEFTFTLEKLVNSVWETVVNATYTIDGESYQTGNDGTFVLKDGETALFSDIGQEYETYRVTEAADATFSQISPVSDSGDPEAATITLENDNNIVSFINGEPGLVVIRKELYGLDEVGENFASILEENGQTNILEPDSNNGITSVYQIFLTMYLYDENGNLLNGDVTCKGLYVNSSGSEETTFTFTNGVLEYSIYAFDQIYLSGLPDGYTVKVEETVMDTSNESVLADIYTASTVIYDVGASQVILSTGADSVEGKVSDNGAILTLTNYVSSADAQSEIFKTMTDSSSDVETGAQITFRVDVYNGSEWVPASGIPYIVVNNTDNGVKVYNTLQETASDGLIVLTKDDNGYPSIRFPYDTVKANVQEQETGDLRMVEVPDGTDDSWGIISGYNSSVYTSDSPSAVIVTDADTIVNANDTSMELIVEKEMDEPTEDTFTFMLIHVLSASELPITSSSDILEYETGAGLHYLVYDSKTGEYLRDGYTNDNGELILSAGEYAVFDLPDDTVWKIYEKMAAGYELESVTVSNGGNGSVLSEDSAAVIQTDKDLTEDTVKYYTLATGNTVGDTLSSDVTTVIFGNTADYSNVVNTLEGTLIGATSDDLIYLYNSGTVAYILADKTINFNSYSSLMFKYKNNLNKIVFDNVDTNNVTDMSNMFINCTSLKTLDLSSFDTTNVKNFNSMFINCSGLELLDLGNFNTSNATSMYYMFGGCSSLKSLNVSSFDTSNVTNMSTMFYYCSSLTELDISNFDTSLVSDMSIMFSGCSKLETLKLGNTFNTSLVTNMSRMFENCSALNTLDLNMFNTSKVKNMSSMFNGCTSMTTLNLSMFDTSCVTNMSSMFNNCKKLSSLNISNFNTYNVENMNSMFGNCQALTSLDLSMFDTSNVTNMNQMFYTCTTLVNLDLSSFDMSKVENTNYMFGYCYVLKSELTINSAACTNYQNMFRYCDYWGGSFTLNYNTEGADTASAMVATYVSNTGSGITDRVVLGSNIEE